MDINVLTSRPADRATTAQLRFFTWDNPAINLTFDAELDGTLGVSITGPKDEVIAYAHDITVDGTTASFQLAVNKDGITQELFNGEQFVNTVFELEYTAATGGEVRTLLRAGAVLYDSRYSTTINNPSQAEADHAVCLASCYAAKACNAAQAACNIAGGLSTIQSDIDTLQSDLAAEIDTRILVDADLQRQILLYADKKMDKILTPGGDFILANNGCGNAQQTTVTKNDIETLFDTLVGRMYDIASYDGTGHNALVNIQGGIQGGEGNSEYYHLTSAEYAWVQSGGGGQTGNYVATDTLQYPCGTVLTIINQNIGLYNSAFGTTNIGLPYDMYAYPSQLAGSTLIRPTGSPSEGAIRLMASGFMLLPTKASVGCGWTGNDSTNIAYAGCWEIPSDYSVLYRDDVGYVLRGGCGMSPAHIYYDTTTYTEDLRFDALAIQRRGNGITADATTGYVNFPATGLTWGADYIYGNIQLPHARVLGTPVLPHVHAIQSAGGMPAFVFQYRWLKLGDTNAGTWKELNTNVQEYRYTGGNLHQMYTGLSFEIPAGDKAGDVIQWRLTRIPRGGMTDTYSVPIGVIAVDFHITLPK